MSQIVPQDEEGEKNFLIDVDEEGRAQTPQAKESDHTTQGKASNYNQPRQPQINVELSESQIGQIEDIKLEQIADYHNNNRLETNQAQNSQDFTDQVKYNLPLEEIYHVKNSCLYDDNERYCPVVMEIIDKNLLAMNGDLPFLLQIWDRKGQLLFERSLATQVVNWNMSDNIFVWQENTNDNQVFLVHLREGLQPLVFTIALAGDIIGLQDSFITNQGGSLQIPLIERMKQSPQNLQWKGQGDVFDKTVEVFDSLNSFDLHLRRDELIGDYQSLPGWKIRQQSEGDLIKNIEAGFEQGLQAIEDLVEELDSDHKDFNTLNMRFSDKIIKRAPHKMIDFMDGYLVVAFQQKLIYADISEILNSYKDDKSNETHHNIQLTKKEIQTLDLDNTFKVICINQIGLRQSNLVVENLENHQLNQLRIYLSKPNKEGIKTLKLSKQGLETTKSKRLAPILKFRSVTKQTHDTKKYYQCSIVVRLDGSFEFYSDFMLTDRIAFPNLRCVDIETDMKQFYLKFVKNSLEIEDDPNAKFEDLSFELMNVNHSWRTKISLNTLERDNYADVWKRIIDRRIFAHVKMFQMAKVLNMHAIVAHKKYIQVFDMVNRKWLKPIDTQGLVRLLSVRSKATIDEDLVVDNDSQEGNTQTTVDIYKRFEIAVISRAALITFYNLDRNGILERQDKEQKTDGRIVAFSEDPTYSTGLSLLVDNISPDSKEQAFLYTKHNNDIIITNNMEKIKGTEFKIQNYNRGQLSTYLEGEMAEEILAADSEFMVTFGSTNLFKSLEYSDEQQQQMVDQVDEFDNLSELGGQTVHEYIRILYVQTKSVGKVSYFPLINTSVKEEDAPANYQIFQPFELPLYEEELNEEGDFLQTFFLSGNDFGDKEQQFARISTKSIKTYSKDGVCEYAFSGFTFRNGISIHGTYLYIIQDKVEGNFESLGYLNSKDDMHDTLSWKPSEVDAGFYVYDITRLFHGRVESYFLFRTIAGQNNYIDFNRSSQRFTFVYDLRSIVVIPFPHTNTINFIGMSQKNDYLIWREKNGFFTAVDRGGNMLTWTCISGKLLYIQYEAMTGHGKNVQGYHVYRSDPDDITYTQDFYAHENRSITLLCNQKSVSNEILATALDQEDENQQDDILNLFSDDQDTNFKIKSTQFTRKNFKFKVLSLETFEDSLGQKPSDCKILFHFEFPLFQKIQNPQLAEFDWDLGVNPEQRLILSKDTTKLLEIINNQAAFVHYRRNVDDTIAEDADEGQKVEWKVAYRIERYPRLISDISSTPFLFSPNFDFIIDYEAIRKIFYIKNNRTGIWRCMIPQNILDIQKYDRSGQGLKIAASRIAFLGADTIRIINEQQQDCIYQIVGLLEEDKGICELKLLSCVKIDNQFLNVRDHDEPHLIRDHYELEGNDVADRLLRRNQSIKMAIGHAKQQNQHFNYFSKIFSVDYKQSWENSFSKLDCEQSFTWLDWKIMDRVVNDNKFDLGNIDLEQTLQIALNILPNGKSFLHKLALLENENVDQTTNVKHAASLFKASRNDVANFFNGTSKGKHMEVPIFEDVFGLTAVDYCLGIEETPHPHVFVSKELVGLNINNMQDFQNFIEKMNVEQKSLNPVLANLILYETKDYSFMYAGDALVNGIIEAINADLPAVGPYLESRLVSCTAENPFLQQMSQRAIRSNVMLSTAADGDFGLITRKPASDDQPIIWQMFEDDGKKEPFDLRYFDIPQIFQKNKQGYEFMNALANSPIEIYSNPVVQLIVETTWQNEWKFFITYIMRPLLLLELILFWLWSNFLLVYYEDKDLARVVSIGSGALYFIMTVRILFEIIQFFSAGKKYFRLEKILDLTVPLFIFINASSRYFPSIDIPEEAFWRINAWCALLVWGRFLISLKSVQYFGWVVRICLDVLSDFMPFLIVYIIITLAFADSFLAIEQILIFQNKSVAPEIKEGNVYERIFEPYVDKWRLTYFNSMAEFDMDFQAKLSFKDWIIFFLGTVVQVIVLLNLLIALVSETFARIFPLNNETSYQEKVRTMVQLQNTFRFLVSKSDNLIEMLFIVKNPAIQMKEAKTGVQRALKKLENSQDQHHQLLDQVSKNVDVVVEFIEAMKQEQ